MGKQTHWSTTDAKSLKCEDEIAQEIYDLIAEAKDRGLSVSEAVLAIVKIAHAVYLSEGSGPRTSIPNKASITKNPDGVPPK